MNMSEKRAAVLLADGYEEGESLFVVDILRRTGVACDSVSIEGEMVRGCHDIYVKADRLISPDIYDDYDMVIIPGGMPGAANLRDCKMVTDWVRKFAEEDKYVAAICAGPMVLKEAGIAEGRTLTSYPADKYREMFAGSTYVDDNADMLSFVSNCMAEVYQVSTATDGDSALSILQHEQIDLVISDVMMPGIDGFELCRRVKSDISLSHIPVILLTARTTDVSRIEGLQLGADDYLTKPFNVEVLRLRVKKIIEWAQNNHQQFRQKINIEPSEITITPLDEEFIKRAIDLVEKNIGDSDFSVETLASAVAMSRSTLYKKLMAITGLGPSEFIRTIRIKRGKALLETSQMQITEIAYAVGFTTVKSFTMNFKAEYGMTPSEFRNRT